MLQLVLSPAHGWEDIAVDDVSSRRLLKFGFLPLVSVAAVTSLLALVYHSETTLACVIERGVACFARYLLAYYVASFFFSLYIPSCTGGEMSLRRNHTFILYSLGLLAVLTILANVLPMVPDMIYLLPVYVYFIMWRGMVYMEVKFDGVVGFMILCLLTLMAPLYLLQYIFSLFIP